jgi:hypothetical protein
MCCMLTRICCARRISSPGLVARAAMAALSKSRPTGPPSPLLLLLGACVYLELEGPRVDDLGCL